MNDNKNNQFSALKCLNMTMNTLRTVVERVRRLFEDGAFSSKYGRYGKR